MTRGGSGLDSGERMVTSCHLRQVRREMGVAGRAGAQFWMCWGQELQRLSRRVGTPRTGPCRGSLSVNGSRGDFSLWGG